MSLHRNDRLADRFLLRFHIESKPLRKRLPNIISKCTFSSFTFQNDKHTLSGCVRNIDEIKLITSDFSHCWIRRSPNMMPRAMIRNMDATTNNIDTAYATYKHHHGNRIDPFFFLILSSCSCSTDFTFVSMRRKNCTRNKLGTNDNTSTTMPMTIYTKDRHVIRRHVIGPGHSLLLLNKRQRQS